MKLTEATKLIDDYFDGNINLTSTQVAIKIHDSAQDDCEANYLDKIKQLEQQVSYLKLTSTEQREDNTISNVLKYLRASDYALFTKKD